ncbi:MAG: hypothetical protein NTW87_05440 [Planctomycetota bacterium]|nr:hypothetical protein [Planctomycetota bacterium]
MGNLECRLAVVVLRRDVGAVLQQKRSGINAAVHGGGHQWGKSALVSLVNLRPEKTKKVAPAWPQ